MHFFLISAVRHVLAEAVRRAWRSSARWALLLLPRQQKPPSSSGGSTAPIFPRLDDRGSAARPPFFPIGGGRTTPRRCARTPAVSMSCFGPLCISIGGRVTPGRCPRVSTECLALLDLMGLIDIGTHLDPFVPHLRSGSHQAD